MSNVLAYYLREVKQMSAEKKSFFKNIAEKFGVGNESEKPIEEITEPSDLSKQEELAEENDALQPAEIPTQEASFATPLTDPSLSQPVEEETLSQSETEPSEPAPKELPELPEATLTEEPKIGELPPQPQLVSPQPVVRVIATHTVRSNETLSHIALRYYGHATPPYYRLIYEFNRDVIGNNMNFIIPGQVLRIPSLPDNLKK
jgi:nucleoid-associated protein YgaU